MKYTGTKKNDPMIAKYLQRCNSDAKYAEREGELRDILRSKSKTNAQPRNPEEKPLRVIMSNSKKIKKVELFIGTLRPRQVDEFMNFISHQPMPTKVMDISVTWTGVCWIVKAISDDSDETPWGPKHFVLFVDVKGVCIH